MAKSKGQMTVQEAGRRGGQTTSREHGPEFYHEIGTKGGRRVRELIQEGKKAESGAKSTARVSTKRVSI